MRSIKKLVKKHGVVDTITIICNTVLYYLCLLLPIDNDLILMESDGDLCDNSFALFDYLIKHGYNNKYKIIWLVYKTKGKTSYNNVYYVNKKFTVFSPMRNYYLARCKWFIYDHINLYANLKKRTGNTSIFLSHGLRNKKNKQKTEQVLPDFVIATGDFPAKAIHILDNVPEDRILKLGYPRIDYLTSTKTDRYEEIKFKLGLDAYKFIVLWMPTFRQSIIADLSENYICNETGLPFFSTLSILEQLNEYLKSINACFYYKIHHLQADLLISKRIFSNVKFLEDYELIDKGIQLYEFISVSDVLVTDYSSVFSDYLITHKPIIYTDDDYRDYQDNRGLWPENYLDFLVGPHCKTIDELIIALDNFLVKKTDEYFFSREKEIGLFHSQKENASKAIIEYFNL